MNPINHPNHLYRIEEMLEYLIRFNGRLHQQLIECEARIRQLEEESKPSEPAPC
ncbi:hypothetical protein ABID53_001112 [Bacillus oleivorans]